MTTIIDELDEALICTQIIDITHDVKSFTLETVEPHQLRFDAGQYLTIRVEIDGAEVERCYTISSPPTRPGALTITVKRVPGGPVSNWLHANLTVGDKLHVSGPLGLFSMVHHRAPKYLFLSAGSGITPLMSMTRTLHDQCDPADLIFVHNARTPRDIIFRDELEDIAARPGVQVHAICEANSPTEEWTGIFGRLTFANIARDRPGSDGAGDIRLRTTAIHECGPGRTRFRGSGPAALPRGELRPRDIEPSIASTPTGNVDRITGPRIRDRIQTQRNNFCVPHRRNHSERGPAQRPEPAIVVHRGCVRHMQVHGCIRYGRHGTRRRDPPTRNRREQDPHLLRHAPAGPRHRRITDMDYPAG